MKNWLAATAAADRSLVILAPVPPLQNVGAAYRDAAETYLAAGDALANGVSDSWYSKARVALERSEQIDTAKDVRDRQINAARGIPDYTHIPSVLYLQLGVVYTRLKDPARALAAFERGRTLDPNAELLERLSDAYATSGQPRAAARAMIEAMELDPARAGLAAKLIDLYHAVDPQSCTGSPQEGLNLRCPMVHADMCGAARNIIAGYSRVRQSFASREVRRSAMSDLGCTAEELR